MMKYNINSETLVIHRLAQARELSGLSQSQVAIMLGIKRVNISEIEAGKRLVADDELARMLEIYSVSMSWLTETDDNAADDLAQLAIEILKLKPEDRKRLTELLNIFKRDEG